MKVEIHTLFAHLLRTVEARPEAVLGFSQATPPRLKEFLDDLDPDLPLDWSGESFLGLPALRQRVLERTGLEGICDLEEVLITAGTAEANFLAFTQLVQPGDEIVVEAPGWPQAEVLARAVGARLGRVHRREDRGWALDLEELAARVTPATRLIFLSNPNNPTGQVLGEAALRQVAEVAGRVGAYVLCDEVYAGLEWEGPRAPAIAALYERGISTGSVSKVLGLQGLRIGWLICRDRQVVFEAMVLRENSSEIMNVLGEHIAEVALREERHARLVQRAREEGRRNLDLLNAFLASREELSWHPPRAGLIGLCRLHLDLDGDELAERLLAPPYRTFVLPGSAFGLPRHLRLGVGGGPAARLELGLERLGRLLDTLGREARRL